FPYRAAIEGQSTTFDVSQVPIIGAGPFTYQWKFQGPFIPGVTNNQAVVDIPGATNSSLTLTNLQLLDSGFYYVTITNPVGSAESGGRLAVYSPASTLQTLSTNGTLQINLYGAFGFNYAIESSTNLFDWVRTLTNVAPYTFTETNTTAYPQRFYRAVLVPPLVF